MNQALPLWGDEPPAEVAPGWQVRAVVDLWSDLLNDPATASPYAVFPRWVGVPSDEDYRRPGRH